MEKKDTLALPEEAFGQGRKLSQDGLDVRPVNRITETTLKADQ